MIKIEVKEYCHACMDFKADVERPIKMFGENDQVIVTDTVVHCEYRGRCEAIHRYLERQFKKANEVIEVDHSMVPKEEA